MVIFCAPLAYPCAECAYPTMAHCWCHNSFHCLLSKRRVKWECAFIHSNLLVFWYPIWPSLRLQWEKAGPSAGRARAERSAKCVAVFGTPFGILSVYSENEPSLGPAFFHCKRGLSLENKFPLKFSFKPLHRSNSCHTFSFFCFFCSPSRIFLLD